MEYIKYIIYLCDDKIYVYIIYIKYIIYIYMMMM